MIADIMVSMDWEKNAEQNFKNILGKIPAPLRPIAERKVGVKAGALAQAAGRNEIIEKDLVDAFFAETPFGFHGPLKTDFKEFGIDHTKYGHPK